MLEASGLTKQYASPAGPLTVLENVHLKLDRGEAVAVTGPSGSGKSTLLYLLGALDRPSAGSVIIDGVNVTTLSEAAQSVFRNRHVGFVFQDHALLPQCTALENVLVPTLVAQDLRDNAAERARALLEEVGLAHRLDHKPAQLSGGEKQRVAIARALIMRPGLLLCDEPTGNLDHDSATAVADLLLRLYGEQHTILIVVTHSAELAARFPGQLELRDKSLQRTGGRLSRH